jgi:hypothetical protein
LNSWYKEELDTYEQPDIYPNRKTSGETNGWIGEHKRLLKKLGATVFWNKEKMKYELKKDSVEINNNEDCLTIDNFDLLKNFILKNGIQTKLYKTGIMADSNTLSSQIFYKNKTLALIDYQNYNHIIIIDILNEDIIPTYFVSNKNNSCQSSAYYSVFDTDKSISTRNGNWCKIIVGIKNNTVKNNILINKETALIIAQKDAQTAYSDLSIYNITAELKNMNWYVDYNLSDLQILGGGPHYIICGKSGNILMRKYDQ